MIPTSPLDNGTKQWIISAQESDPFIASQIINEVLNFLRLQSGVEIIQIIRIEASTKIVIRATDITIANIQSVLGNNIIISPDKPLQLF